MGVALACGIAAVVGVSLWFVGDSLVDALFDKDEHKIVSFTSHACEVAIPEVAAYGWKDRGDGTFAGNLRRDIKESDFGADYNHDGDTDDEIAAKHDDGGGVVFVDFPPTAIGRRVYVPKFDVHVDTLDAATSSTIAPAVLAARKAAKFLETINEGDYHIFVSEERLCWSFKGWDEYITQRA